MKTIVVTLWMLFLAGCSSWNTMQSAASIQGAKAADEELETAEWGVCMAPTVGAWQRRYGGNPVKAEGWGKLCSKPAIVPAPTPAPTPAPVPAP